MGSAERSSLGLRPVLFGVVWDLQIACAPDGARSCAMAEPGFQKASVEKCAVRLHNLALRKRLERAETRSEQLELRVEELEVAFGQDAVTNDPQGRDAKYLVKMQNLLLRKRLEKAELHASELERQVEEDREAGVALNETLDRMEKAGRSKEELKTDPERHHLSIRELRVRVRVGPYELRTVPGGAAAPAHAAFAGPGVLDEAESFELDEWGSLDEIARLESENRELLQRVQTLECGSSSSSDSSPESSEGSARPRLGSKQTVRFRRQATTDPAQRLNILYWKTLVERYVHSKSCSFQRLVISRWETFAERLVYWSQADSATEALKKDFQEQRKLNEDPLRVARQEAEEQAHIAQRLEEDMEARCSLEMSEAREKLVVTEQNYELVRQRVQELEEDQFEHSQSFMRQRQTALCDSGFGEMPQLIIPESAPVTAASLNHDLASTIAVHIRKNLTLQRRMAGLLEWRSTTTVSKLQYDIAREERNRESPDTRVAWLRAELEEERLKGEQEQEEHRGHRTSRARRPYEDQIAQLQETLATKVHQLRKSASPPKSPSRSRASAPRNTNSGGEGVVQIKSAEQEGYNAKTPTKSNGKELQARFFGASLAERFSKHEKDEASASEARSRKTEATEARGAAKI
ncbi:unnamed protein product [Effrenium voratum]|uniref:Uncharacterized protein n=1 Tax=Effrenium voratum TaxID=2562239 RepID=A0AA36NI28_9DINO|nr:unnamed protein product [Effrenium voratum]